MLLISWSPLGLFSISFIFIFDHRVSFPLPTRAVCACEMALCVIVTALIPGDSFCQHNLGRGVAVWSSFTLIRLHWSPEWHWVGQTVQTGAEDGGWKQRGGPCTMLICGHGEGMGGKKGGCQLELWEGPRASPTGSVSYQGSLDGDIGPSTGSQQRGALLAAPLANWVPCFSMCAS